MNAWRNLLLGLLVGLVLGAALSASLSFHDWTSAEASRTVQLRQGWNLLVWSADSQTAASALGVLAGDLVMAYGWQRDSQTFSRYVPDRADVSTMSEVEKDSGYWLLLSRDALLTVPTSASECPQPTPCPQCPEPSDVAAELVVSEACTGEKLLMELEEVTGVELGADKQFFNQYCQGVELLEGSHYGAGCAIAGMTSGLTFCPTASGEALVAAQQATMLVERYCNP